MKKYIATIFLIFIYVMYGESNIKEYSIPNLKKSKEAKNILYNNISFQFNVNKRRLKIKQKDIIVSKITQNIFKQDSKMACQKLFLFALKDLQEKAIKINGNKIINIKSFLGNSSYSSTKKFKCDVGNVFSVVTLKADIM